MCTVYYIELSENATLNTLARQAEGMTSDNESLVDFRIEDATYKNNILQQTMFKYLEMTDYMGITVGYFLSTF